MGVLVAALVLLAAAVSGAGEGQVAVQAVRIAAAHGPVQIDGLLDEPGWTGAPAAGGFRQREPDEGRPATEETTIRVLYDEDTLYVGVVAHDGEPDEVIARVLERDTLMSAGDDNTFRFTGDDAVALILDPFQDHRNAFVFATNPNGAEFDALITDENPAFNADWRGIWRVAARRGPEGWSAEFAIPFRTLRYPSGGTKPWGLNVERMIRRKNEDTLWSAWARADGGLHRVSRAGRIEGLRDLPRSGFNVELKPFGLTGLTQERPDGPGRAPAVSRWRVGGDGKWEIRPGVVLDATVRPDFAQVEADAQVVNLTRFELFFPEKREFFLENAGLFDFGTRGSFETPPFLLFFSRRIGIAAGEEVPVLGGLRLSGRAGKQTIGLLSVLADGAPGEPRSSFGALRAKRDIGDRGYVGAMLTDRRSSRESETDVGLDASLWPTRTLNVQGFAARTSDPAGRTDSAYRAWAEYQGDPLYFNAEYLHIGPRAATGMGFVTRTDTRRASGKGQYTVRPDLLGLRLVALFAGGKYVTRVDGDGQDGNGFSGFSAVWESGENMSVTEVRGFTVVDGGFPLAGRIPISPGRYPLGDTEIFAGTSGNRPVSGFMQLSLLRIWRGRLSSLTTGLQVRGGTRLSVSGTYTRSEADMPGGAFVAHVPGLRLTWTQSTRLAAASYLQYNSLTRRFIANVRLHFIHRPGSDLFLVFNEEQETEAAPESLVSRGLALKLNYAIRL
jgi:hypothetical protein